jgi:hypothetical protein
MRCEIFNVVQRFENEVKHLSSLNCEGQILCSLKFSEVYAR